MTGGIGAGKSEALRAFARHGAAVVSSDEIVHHLIRSDPEVKAAMLERLGEGILGEDGEIDRARVGEIVFGDREALAWLEALLHPRVSAEYLNWREQLAKLPAPPEVCVTEVPLLYEVGAEDRFDKVVVITAPRLLREQRTNVPMAGRSDRLIDDREKVKRADFSYVNTGGLEELDAWVAGVMEELRASRGPARR
ncbi:MAG TPA: dephospho-CoA kinase [Gaiellaceae bacterium]|nr:dephospho-CoA kinase [Gaiellaceae bacterium]